MQGCYYCEMAKSQLQEEIRSGEIILIPHTEASAKDLEGVKGFPHFINDKNQKTHTGWPGTKDALIEQLKTKEPFYEGLDDEIGDFFNKPKPRKENFVMENVPYFPIVKSANVPTPDIHYTHHMSGEYMRLGKIWTVQPPFTA